MSKSWREAQRNLDAAAAFFQQHSHGVESDTRWATELRTLLDNALLPPSEEGNSDAGPAAFITLQGFDPGIKVRVDRLAQLTGAQTVGLFLHGLMLLAELCRWEPRPEGSPEEWGPAWAVATDVRIAEELVGLQARGVAVEPLPGRCHRETLIEEGWDQPVEFSAVFDFLRRYYRDRMDLLALTFQPFFHWDWVFQPIFWDKRQGYEKRVQLRFWLEVLLESGFCANLPGLVEWIRHRTVPEAIPWQIELQRFLNRERQRLTTERSSFTRGRWVGEVRIPRRVQERQPLLMALHNAPAVLTHPEFPGFVDQLERGLASHPLRILVFDTAVRQDLPWRRELFARLEPGPGTRDLGAVFEYLRRHHPTARSLLLVTDSAAWEGESTAPLRERDIFRIVLAHGQDWGPTSPVEPTGP